jgi:glycosyltransferase involved in cell wall biosynthesis
VEELRVTHHCRKPRAGQFSIERLFASVREALPPDVRCDIVQCPFRGGIFGRIANVLNARFRRGRVNHILGDVHYLALAFARDSTILTIHDAAALGRMKGWRSKLYRFFWFEMPTRRARVITVISEATRRVLVNELRVPDARIVVIPDCISPAFQPSPKQFNEAAPVVLQIGTKTNKNIARLAEAVRGTRCVLEIVGRLSSEQLDHLQRNGVQFRNTWDLSEEQILEKYRECDLLAFISTVEGFGVPIVEAQTVGRPVLASNVSSIPEVAGDGAC